MLKHQIAALKSINVRLRAWRGSGIVVRADVEPSGLREEDDGEPFVFGNGRKRKAGVTGGIRTGEAKRRGKGKRCAGKSMGLDYNSAVACSKIEPTE
jgi:hypothetical protein